MVQGVLTEGVSCYIQNNDSSPHVPGDFHEVLEIPGDIFVLTVCNYRMDVYHLSCLQNVEVGILYM